MAAVLDNNMAEYIGSATKIMATQKHLITKIR